MAAPGGLPGAGGHHTPAWHASWQGNSYRAAEPAARDAAAVAAALLGPVQGLLDDHDRVLVMPSGAMHLLPFHALPLHGLLLGADHVMSQPPAASLIPRLAGRPRPQRDGSVLAVATRPPIRPATCAGCPARTWKALTVARVLGAEPLTGAAADEPSVRAALAARSPVVHLATHGLLDEDAPYLSSLALSGSDELTVAELLGLGLDADVAILSAGDSGRGEVTLGGDVVGLARGLLAAGARHSVVSLWPVDDQVGCLTMAAFAGGSPPGTRWPRPWPRRSARSGRPAPPTATTGTPSWPIKLTYPRLRPAAAPPATSRRRQARNRRRGRPILVGTIRARRSLSLPVSGTTEPETAGERWSPMKRALLVGSQTGGLTGVHADVAAMDDVLTGLGFTAILTTGADATADGIVERYRALIDDTGPDDTAVFYYSGHGGRQPNPLPAWLQYILPTDCDDRSGDRVRCMLAEELTALQAQLTARSRNVTTIMDCCHSARMSRGGSAVPKANDQLALPAADLVRRWQELAAQPRYQGDANPDAVRVVACAPDQSAYEDYDPYSGERHGMLTAALVRVLRSPEAATITWSDALEVIRGAVSPLAALQRPERKSRAAQRLLFSVRPAGRRRAAAGQDRGQPCGPPRRGRLRRDPRRPL